MRLLWLVSLIVASLLGVFAIFQIRLIRTQHEQLAETKQLIIKLNRLIEIANHAPIGFVTPSVEDQISKLDFLVAKQKDWWLVCVGSAVIGLSSAFGLVIERQRHRANA